MTAKLKTAVTLRTDFAVSGHRMVDGQRIYAAQVLTPFSDTQDELRGGFLSVSPNDTHVKHLEDALTGATGEIAITVNNDGANETITIGLSSGTATSGQVFTADGSGGGSWQDQQGSGGMGVTTFRALTDTPGTYGGQGGRLMRLNTAATALEFIDNAALVAIIDAAVGHNHWRTDLSNFLELDT